MFSAMAENHGRRRLYGGMVWKRPKGNLHHPLPFQTWLLDLEEHGYKSDIHVLASEATGCCGKMMIEYKV